MKTLAMASDSEIETSTLMPHADPRPPLRRPLSSGALPPVILAETSAGGKYKAADVRESLSDESLRADTPEGKVWTDEGRKWLEFGEAVLKEVWSDARDYLHTSIHPKVSPSRPRVLKVKSEVDRGEVWAGSPRLRIRRGKTENVRDEGWEKTR